jgi:Flp pilus assembly pilin Flp
MKSKLMGFLNDDQGLMCVELAVAGSLVAVAVILALQALGFEVGQIIDAIARFLPAI